MLPGGKERATSNMKLIMLGCVIQVLGFWGGGRERKSVGVRGGGGIEERGEMP